MFESGSRQTTDHDEIRAWVEERDGQPARVEGTGEDGDGLLRIGFDGTDEGEESRFSKLVSRED